MNTEQQCFFKFEYLTVSIYIKSKSMIVTKRLNLELPGKNARVHQFLVDVIPVIPETICFSLRFWPTVSEVSNMLFL